MARRQRSGASAGSPEGRQRKQEQKAEQKRQSQRRHALRIAAVVAVVAAAGGAVLFGLNLRDSRLHDLSVVGSGVPAIVQVHDITCPFCNELRDNVEAVRSDFDRNDLIYRIADVDTDDGLAFAAQYTDQRRVTLLYFDGAGALTDVRSGVQTEDELRRSFSAHIEGAE